jgi:hypothetical protein
MAASSRGNAARMLRDLVAVDRLASDLWATAPEACAAEGGAGALVAAYGAPTGAGFWALRLSLAGDYATALWEAMADEHQRVHRVNVGEG